MSTFRFSSGTKDLVFESSPPFERRRFSEHITLFQKLFASIRHDLTHDRYVTPRTVGQHMYSTQRKLRWPKHPDCGRNKFLLCFICELARTCDFSLCFYYVRPVVLKFCFYHQAAFIFLLFLAHGCFRLLFDLEIHS